MCKQNKRKTVQDKLGVSSKLSMARNLNMLKFGKLDCRRRLQYTRGPIASNYRLRPRRACDYCCLQRLCTSRTQIFARPSASRRVTVSVLSVFKEYSVIRSSRRFGARLGSCVVRCVFGIRTSIQRKVTRQYRRPGACYG